MTQETRVSKELVAAVFGRAAETYGQVGPSFFGHFGERLVEIAGIKSGDVVLDVAAGRGAVLFPAATRVGPSGSVLGIDIADQMVSETSAELARRSVANAQMKQMDAENLDLPDSSVDVVTCGFGLMFLPSLQRALSEMSRVLRPGGVLAVTTWGEPDSRWARNRELMQKYSQYTTVSVRDMQAQPLGKPEDLQAALESASFQDVTIVTEAHDVAYADEETWWASIWSHGARGPLEVMQPAALADYKAEAFSLMQPHRQPDGFHQIWTAVIATGRKSG